MGGTLPRWSNWIAVSPNYVMLWVSLVGGGRAPACLGVPQPPPSDDVRKVKVNCERRSGFFFQYGWCWLTIRTQALAAVILKQLHPCTTLRSPGEWRLVLRVKFSLELAMNAQRGSRGMGILLLTSALDGGGWLTPCSGHFIRGKETRYALYRRLSGLRGRFGRLRKFSPPQGFDPRTVQPVTSCCTDWAIQVQPLMLV